MYYIEDKVPELRDLMKYVTMRNFNYAQKWRELGVKLNLSTLQLDEIQYNLSISSASQFCLSMLDKWLQINTTASWGQVISAINELTPVSEVAYTGMNLTKYS